MYCRIYSVGLFPVKSFIRRYIVSDYHQEMKDLMRQGREVRPLFYHKDRPLLRTLRMEKNLLGHFQKFKRYYQRKS